MLAKNSFIASKQSNPKSTQDSCTSGKDHIFINDKVNIYNKFKEDVRIKIKNRLSKFEIEKQYCFLLFALCMAKIMIKNIKKKIQSKYPRFLV